MLEGELDEEGWVAKSTLLLCRNLPELADLRDVAVAEFLQSRPEPFLIEIVGAAEVFEIVAIVAQGRVDESREKIGVDRFERVQLHRADQA
jgi:hypothetical protein